MQNQETHDGSSRELPSSEELSSAPSSMPPASARRGQQAAFAADARLSRAVLAHLPCAA
eukprot:CAMPEP_0174720524 /NCGR_PEP_ID=MMETSP1094-20130205/33729_1 /TAXON_ID=156173 /ORGANISM="Chrysochromulina brevifilum, Strain UTEX LB 985" /LENGTH=58 /DNA_ID=CAMNT_0015921017 /DNA_START=566 /DNA_END=738 /DNA_ORIENTATION=+